MSYKAIWNGTMEETESIKTSQEASKFLGVHIEETVKRLSQDLSYRGKGLEIKALTKDGLPTGVRM